jgi:phosphopantothenoylcysteine decarboxylase/phosphopantothenate--cysteine ligase
MRLLLGVSGGIAAYKACELTSLALKAGFEVQVVMSAHATRFVGAISFEGLTGRPVMLDTFAPSGAMEHIDLPKWCTHACLAPATANSLAKLAHGLADDALSTTFLALRRGTPCVLAPAMNTEMWFNPATQRNLAWLRDQERYTVVDPVEKRLACGDVGLGGLASPEQILRAIQDS